MANTAIQAKTIVRNTFSIRERVPSIKLRTVSVSHRILFISSPGWRLPTKESESLWIFTYIFSLKSILTAEPSRILSHDLNASPATQSA